MAHQIFGGGLLANYTDTLHAQQHLQQEMQSQLQNNQFRSMGAQGAALGIQAPPKQEGPNKVLLLLPPVA